MNDYLGKNLTVGVISPSISLSGAAAVEFEAGLDFLHRLGFKTVVAPSVWEGMRLTPVSDSHKIRDIMAMYRDPEIKLLFCPHGGASSQRLLPGLDYELIAANPKPIIGFSDTTALQMGIYAKTGNPYVSGFLLIYDFKTGKIDPLVERSLKTVLGGAPVVAQGGETVYGGKAEGVLIGDCLSEISYLTGTPFSPDLSGKILLIEDECEKPYKIDFMLTQLRQRPDFKALKGLVLGSFTECESAINSHGTIDDVLDLFCRDLKLPLIRNFPFGHIPSRYVLPMGCPFRIDADNCRLEQIL